MRYYKVINIIDNKNFTISSKHSAINKTYTAEKLKVGSRAFFYNIDNPNNYFVTEKIDSIVKDTTNNKNINIIILCTNKFKYVLKEMFIKENECRFKLGEKLIYINKELEKIEIVTFVKVCTNIKENYLVECKDVKENKIKKYDKFRLFTFKEKDNLIDLIHKEVNSNIYQHRLKKIKQNSALDIKINEIEFRLNRNNVRKVLFNRADLDKEIYFNTKKIKRLRNKQKKNTQEYNSIVKNSMLKLNYLIDIIENI